jgi:predicted ATPase/DNA-binding SARP family transcriptional activator
MKAIRFEVLGPLRVGGDLEVALTRPAHRRLLSILLLEGGRRLSTDALIERFWDGDPPQTAKAALQTHVSALRGLLPSGTVVTEGYGYALPLDGHALDAVEFSDRAAAARQHVAIRDWSNAVAAADDALARWRGRPFEELRDDPFAQPEVRRLEELRLELLELRAEALVATGHEADVLPELERLVVEHPLRERLWEQLMLARYRLGRHADALDAYQRARDELDELGLEPGPGLHRLQERILRHDDELHRRPPTNLPPELTSFVGRERELTEVRGYLGDHRLVTITGVGGAGKTRLARRVAEESLEGFDGGSWLVELAPLAAPDLVVRQVATTLGLRLDGDDLLAELRTATRDLEVLVLLDNAEHLLDGVAAVARALLEGGRGVRVLATSRAPLGVPGEVVYDLPPMAVPDTPSATARELLRYDAVRLFAERAALARPGFSVEGRDAEAVVEICRRLDGVPLAIELAAARVRILDPRTIAERLDDRFRLLTVGSSTAPPRQRTLEATVWWSHDLLSPAERTLFARLGVFEGDLDAEMAEAVVMGDGLDRAEVLPLLADLVDRSLVATSATNDGRRRFRLLETLREFALTQLDASGEMALVRQRHRAWCVAFAREVVECSLGPDRAEQLERLEAASDDLRAALVHDPGPTDDEAVWLTHALASHWSEHSHIALARRYLETALTRCQDLESEAELRSFLARTRYVLGDVDAAVAEITAAVELVRDRPPSRARVRAFGRSAFLEAQLIDHDPGAAVPLAREAVRTAEALDDPAAELHARQVLAQALGWSGEIDAGLGEQRAALGLARATGDRALVVEACAGLFDLIYLHPTERRDGPAELARELLELTPEAADSWQAHRITRIEWVAYVLLQTGRWERAEQLTVRLADRHLEGYERTWHLMVHATLRWMQGRTRDAQADLDALTHHGVNPGWYHDYHPLRADVAADEGRLGDVRAIAAEFLAVEVHPSEESKKLGVLCPLVRAEVDAALAAEGAARDDHVGRAVEALEQMRHLLVTFPPPTGGSVQFETADTYLRFAEAEVTRVAHEDGAARWRAARDAADYVYFRLYAGRRLAEAQLEAGERAAGIETLRAVLDQAREVGAGRIVRELAALAVGIGVEVPAGASGGGGKEALSGR